MANLKEIRTRIKSVITTQQMTKAMKMVAAAKLRRAQDSIIRLRPYASKLGEIMDNLTSSLSEGIDSPYTESRKADKVLIVVVTSNRGLCGPFNTNALKQASQVIEEQYKEQNEAGNLEILAIGKKAYEFFKRRKYNVVDNMNHDVFTGLSFERVGEVAEMVMKGFTDKRWDRVDLVYNEFKNVVTQIRRHEQFLPLEASAASKTTTAAKTANVDYIFEPNRADILLDLIPKSLKIKFYRAILESNAGEQGARMSAMDKATDNAQELLKSLRLTYNRARQANITTEILEIVAGAEALAAGK